MLAFKHCAAYSRKDGKKVKCLARGKSGYLVLRYPPLPIKNDESTHKHTKTPRPGSNAAKRHL